MDFKFTEKQAPLEAPSGEPSARENEIDLSRVVFSGQYEDNPALRELSIAEGVLEICENAFRDFEYLEKVTLPKSLKQISACAFSGCKNLKEVKIPFGVVEILDEAFSSCPSLTSVTLPDSVKRIGEG